MTQNTPLEEDQVILYLPYGFSFWSLPFHLWLARHQPQQSRLRTHLLWPLLRRRMHRSMKTSRTRMLEHLPSCRWRAVTTRTRKASSALQSPEFPRRSRTPDCACTVRPMLPAMVRSSMRRTPPGPKLRSRGIPGRGAWVRNWIMRAAPTRTPGRNTMSRQRWPGMERSVLCFSQTAVMPPSFLLVKAASRLSLWLPLQAAQHRLWMLLLSRSPLRLRPLPAALQHRPHPFSSRQRRMRGWVNLIPTRITATPPFSVQTAQGTRRWRASSALM